MVTRQFIAILMIGPVFAWLLPGCAGRRWVSAFHSGYQPSAPRDLAWLASCPEVWVVVARPNLSGAETHTLLGGITTEHASREAEACKRMRMCALRSFAHHLERVLPDKTVTCPATLTPQALARVDAGVVAICSVVFNVQIGGKGAVYVTEFMPPRFSTKPNSLVGKRTWLARPASGAKRRTPGSETRLPLTAEVDGGLFNRSVHVDYDALESEVCAWLDRRASDLADQVVEALKWNARER